MNRCSNCDEYDEAGRRDAMPNSEMRDRAREFFPQALSGIGSPEKMYEVMADFATLERAAARREALLIINELVSNVERVVKKYGVHANGTPKDWTEWQDVRDSLTTLRSKLAAPEKEETNG